MLGMVVVVVFGAAVVPEIRHQIFLQPGHLLMGHNINWQELSMMVNSSCKPHRGKHDYEENLNAVFVWDNQLN